MGSRVFASALALLLLGCISQAAKQAAQKRADCEATPAHCTFALIYSLKAGEREASRRTFLRELQNWRADCEQRTERPISLGPERAQLCAAAGAARLGITALGHPLEWTSPGPRWWGRAALLEGAAPIDTAQALEYLTRACDPQLVPGPATWRRLSMAGCVLLGDMYRTGTGVARSDARARTFYRMACRLRGVRKLQPLVDGCARLRARGDDGVAIAPSLRGRTVRASGEAPLPVSGLYRVHGGGGFHDLRAQNLEGCAGGKLLACADALGELLPRICRDDADGRAADEALRKVVPGLERACGSPGAAKHAWDAYCPMRGDFHLLGLGVPIDLAKAREAGGDGSHLPKGTLSRCIGALAKTPSRLLLRGDRAGYLEALRLVASLVDRLDTAPRASVQKELFGIVHGRVNELERATYRNEGAAREAFLVRSLVGLVPPSERARFDARVAPLLQRVRRRHRARAEALKARPFAALVHLALAAALGEPEPQRFMGEARERARALLGASYALEGGDRLCASLSFPGAAGPLAVTLRAKLECDEKEHSFDSTEGYTYFEDITVPRVVQRCGVPSCATDGLTQRLRCSAPPCWEETIEEVRRVERRGTRTVHHRILRSSARGEVEARWGGRSLRIPVERTAERDDTAWSSPHGEKRFGYATAKDLRSSTGSAIVQDVVAAIEAARLEDTGREMVAAIGRRDRDAADEALAAYALRRGEVPGAGRGWLEREYGLSSRDAHLWIVCGAKCTGAW